MKLQMFFNQFCAVIILIFFDLNFVFSYQDLDTLNWDLFGNDDSTDEVRCYCNLPVCIASAYMCKTTNKEGGGCFTDVIVSIPVQRASHGCLDLLDRNRHVQCRNEPSIVNSEEHLLASDNGSDVNTVTSSGSSSLLLCCNEDMCNHVDMPDNHIKYNDSVMAAVLAGTKTFSGINHQLISTSNVGNTALYDNNEVWFRAATIAVPICGALILCILIILAIRILRSDSDDIAINAKLRSTRGGSGGSVLPLYTPIHLKTPSSTMSSNIINDNNISDTKSTIKKSPLLFQYQDQQCDSEHLHDQVINSKSNPYTNSNLFNYNANHKEIIKYNFTNNKLTNEDINENNSIKPSSTMQFGSYINNNRDLFTNKNKFNNCNVILNDSDSQSQHLLTNERLSQCNKDDENIVATLVSLTNSNNNNNDNSNLRDNKFNLYDKTLINIKPNVINEL